MKSKMNNKSNPKRAGHILELYKSGKTLAEIGEVFGFTRSRAQQIVIKEMKKDILKRLGINKLNRDEKILLDVAVKEEIQEIFNKRKESKKTSEERETTDRISKKMKETPSYQVFTTVSEYLKALGEDRPTFMKYFPDIARAIKQKQNKMWSRHYIKCRVCGTTSVKHVSHGLCENCYTKSDIFKNMQNASRLRNIEKWRKSQSEYSKEYSKRPEVIARLRQREDQKKYDGNREKAILRDGEKCTKCGITRKESLERLGRDLYVYHIGDTKDNRMENLTTICQKCHNKNAKELMNKNSKES